MIQHHPSDETLLAYAAGRLPRAHRVVVRAHLARCEACRRSLALAKSVAAAKLEALPAAPLAPPTSWALVAREVAWPCEASPDPPVPPPPVAAAPFSLPASSRPSMP